MKLKNQYPSTCKIVVSGNEYNIEFGQVFEPRTQEDGEYLKTLVRVGGGCCGNKASKIPVFVEV